MKGLCVTNNKGKAPDYYYFLDLSQEMDESALILEVTSDVLLGVHLKAQSRVQSAKGDHTATVAMKT